MNFHDILNQYIEKIDCTAKELANAAGISAATLSRYRTGERMPNQEQMRKLLDGIVSLAAEKELEGISAETVYAAFGEFISDTDFDYERFTDNLNALLGALEISNSDLSRFLNFDPSYLSRIRLGQRRPSDPDGFIEGLCRYVARRKSGENERAVLAELIGSPMEELSSENNLISSLRNWLGSGTAPVNDSMESFLKHLDTFDLDEYIHAIHFDELKVPSMPFQLPTSKTYYGVEAMKQGELDFFKATVLSKSMEPIFMCSDMPMEDMGKDLDFGKKWMFAIAMSLKKGLHLNIIHNIDRPFPEMMLGLESWIPIYMTGQVSPYYLKGKHNNVYCHFNYVSGQAALTGECIQGYHNDGKYYLTKNKDEVAYYQKKAKRLLSKAQPLMEIFREENRNSYQTFLSTDAQTEGSRHHLLSSLPIYTLPEDLLTELLNRHCVSEGDKEQLMGFVKKQRELAEAILENNMVCDEIPFLSPEEFAAYPVALSLSGAFYEKELFYSYEEYVKHLQATKDFEKTHSNYRLKLAGTQVFRNIQIQIHEGKWVMVSKAKAPVIHFVIRHPKMLEAFENFTVPYTEA